jgi:hypothetical protein
VEKMKNPTLWVVIALSISVSAILFGSDEPTEQKGAETIELVSAWTEWNEALARPSDPKRIEDARKDLDEFDKDAVTALNAYGNARYEKGRSDALRM